MEADFKLLVASELFGSGEAINRLDQALSALPQVDFKTTHQLVGGIYTRTIHIPAGVAIVGAVHKTDHVNVVTGDITVSTSEGQRRLTGSHVLLLTKAGTQRAGYAHADTTWTAICRTDKTEIEDIEADLVETPQRLQTRNPAIGCAPLVRLEN